MQNKWLSIVNERILGATLSLDNYRCDRLTIPLDNKR
jgi:hypothetical protein